MRRLAVAAVALATLGTAAPDPFGFFAPTIAVTEKDRRDLANGRSVAHVVPSPKGQVSIFAAVPVDVTADRVAAWMRAIALLKQSAQVPVSRRFSDPPRPEDLDDLVFDTDTLEDARSCRPGDCGLKLSAAEIAQVHQAIDAAGAPWRAAAQRELRAVMLGRARAYLSGGHFAMPPTIDGGTPIIPHERFAALLRASAFLVAHDPTLAMYLGRFPDPSACPLESFLYWSKEDLGTSPSYTITQVVLAYGDGASTPEIVAAGKQVFATRYTNGSLGVTALVRDQDGVHEYLVYVNRTDVDLLHGAFAGLLRWFVERRVKAEAPGVLNGVRRRLESGDPGE